MVRERDGTQALQAERSQVARVEPPSQVQQAEPLPQALQGGRSPVQRGEPPLQARGLVAAPARRRICFPQRERGQQERPQRVAQSQFYREAWS